MCFAKVRSTGSRAIAHIEHAFIPVDVQAGDALGRFGQARITFLGDGGGAKWKRPHTSFDHSRTARSFSCVRVSRNVNQGERSLQMHGLQSNPTGTTKYGFKDVRHLLSCKAGLLGAPSESDTVKVGPQKQGPRRDTRWSVRARMADWTHSLYNCHCRFLNVLDVDIFSL